MKPFSVVSVGLLFLFPLIVGRVSAQTIIPNKAAPHTGPVSQDPGALFVGEWEWASGGEVFHITLTRNPTFQFPQDPQHREMNIVTGNHRYVRNGVTIEQSYTGSTAPYSMLCVPADNTTLSMSFHELTKNKWGKVSLTFVPGNANQLTWQLKSKEMIYAYPNVGPTPGFTVPTNVTLTRVP